MSGKWWPLEKVKIGFGRSMLFGPFQVGGRNCRSIPVLKLSSTFKGLICFQDGSCSVFSNSLFTCDSIVGRIGILCFFVFVGFFFLHWLDLCGLVSCCIFVVFVLGPFGFLGFPLFFGLFPVRITAIYGIGVNYGSLIRAMICLE